MLPSLNLPASLLDLLIMLRPCFTAPGFATFCGLAAGLAGRVRRRTVAGMLLGGCLQHAWPHDRAHYFFARARWELDELGLAVARLAVLLAVPPGADLEVAVDDSVFRRSGRKVHGAGWQHDGSSPSLSKLSYGNCFVTAGIVVRLPFCARAVCLPVLARLHLPGKGKGPGKVAMAAALISQLGAALGDRTVHVVADAAYHGPALRTLPRRILAAATEEFTKHGIAGARVDRIAAAANSNKAMLYAYFGNKEQLFEAAFALMVTAATDAVPFDARDLAGYAVAMFERYRTDPHVARLSDWYRLEHGRPGPDDAVSAAQRGRLAAIAKAQRDKVISDRLTPQELFGVITALARMGTPEFTRLNPPSSTAAARTAVHDIVKQLVRP